MLTVVDADVAACALPLDELGSRIVGLAGRLAAATCRWLLLVAEFDSRDGCARFGLASTARWLLHYCGLSRRTAVEHVRVARAVAAFPDLADAMLAGRLSYSHVRAISRLADKGEYRLVADLIEVAEQGTVGQLEAMVRGLRTVEHQDPGTPPPREYVSHGWTGRSQWRLSARLAPERGAVVQSAVEAVARAEGITHDDALVRMAEIALTAVADGSSPRHLRGDERAAVVLHLDAARLPAADVPTPDAPTAGRPRTDQAAENRLPDLGPASPDTVVHDLTTEPAPPERSAHRTRPYAWVRGGPGLPDAVVKRLLCAGRIRTAVHDPDGGVREVGRSHRLVSERQFRALLLRDGGCAHPGCGSTTRLEAHHVRHWINGGRTEVANLVLLCWRHHHAHHDGEFQVMPLGGGRFRFRRRDGRILPEHVDPSRFIGTTNPIEDDHTDVEQDAATTRWSGERLNRHWALAVLAERRDSVRRPTGQPRAG